MVVADIGVDVGVIGKRKGRQQATSVSVTQELSDRNQKTSVLLGIVPHPKGALLMANDDNKNPNEKQTGENRDGKYHFNPGNMAGKKPGDAKQTDENRGEPHKPEKPAD